MKWMLRLTVIGILIMSKSMGMDVYSIVKQGESFSAEQVADFEENLKIKPDNELLRTQLLGYYFGQQYVDASAKKNHAKHVLWLIENQPEAEVLGMPYGGLYSFWDPEAYQQGKAAWIRQLEAKPDNLAILENSAVYFLQSDKELAEKSLIRARELDPKNSRWPKKLGQIYALKAQGVENDEGRKNAGKALVYYEQAYALASFMGKDTLRTDIAKNAFKAGELNTAATYAQKMLDLPGIGWNSGNNIHYGNIILGHVALQNGNTEDASNYLIKAGKTKGSPQLDSFGPNFTLAKALLENGESETVLKYLDECAEFWERDQGKLTQWAVLIRAGKDPFIDGSL